MSRQLDLQIYLALNDYELKEIPEERYDDYMSEPHYSTDAEAMLELDREMRVRGWRITNVCCHGESDSYLACYQNKYWHREGSVAENEPLARALAAYKALTGKGWEG